VLGLIWWFFGVFRVQGTTKEEFVANAIHVESNTTIYTLLVVQGRLQM
jgi:hypothetical protein